MIWYLAVLIFGWFAWGDLVHSGFPGFDADAPRNFLEWCFMVFVWLFGCAPIGLVATGIATFVGGLMPRHSVKSDSYPLIALREKDGSNGNFFLGSGTLNSAEYYFWYRRAKGGEIQGGKTYRSPSVRIYQGDYAPKMDTWKCEYSIPGCWVWVWLIGIDVRSDITYSPDFYIPEGSIMEGYSL